MREKGGNKEKPKPDRYAIEYNNEGYRDPTAAAAIKNVMRKGINGRKTEKIQK